MFFIAAAVYAIGGILFCVLAKGTVQPWAKDSSTIELDVISTESTKVSSNGHAFNENGGNGSPIYQPKSNGAVAATEPMLTTKEV